MLQTTTLYFLKKIKKNNNKPWLDANRPLYETAKLDMINLCQVTIKDLSNIDKGYEELEAKKCLFRINRDVRFSNNKDPYKTNMGAGFSIGGKKTSLGGFYIHIEPGACFVGGGLWQPDAENLKKIRQEIDYNFKEFKGIVESKKFKAVFGQLSEQDKLVNPPKGYDAENPAIDYLKLKSFTAGLAFQDKEITEKDFSKKVKNCFQTLAPLIEFLNRAVL